MGSATRLFLWKNVVGLILEKPVFGYGPDTHAKVMRAVNREHNQKFNTDSIIDRAHNNYLDIAIGRGLFGLGAYLSVVVVFMVWLWKTMKREMERSRKILFCCIFSAFLGYLINDLFIFSVVSVSPTFWSLMGVTLMMKNIPNR
jgi:putative inorganic carbon (HCO3(-)) transporter